MDENGLRNDARYTVWVGGVEITDWLVTLKPLESYPGSTKSKNTMTW